eukprot:scaffold157130_cov11-Prasinocladus_malaysianus.AAC.1
MKSYSKLAPNWPGRWNKISLTPRALVPDYESHDNSCKTAFRIVTYGRSISLQTLINKRQYL